MAESGAPITKMLNRAWQGDREASARVFQLLYEKLRGLAAAQRARLRTGETLDTTALVHEAYLRLVGRQEISWRGRHHFYCTAARSMRDILVEEARRKSARKRGGDQRRVELDEAAGITTASPEDLIALDDILKKLELDHVDKFQIVMLRYFIGLTVPEIAEVLGISLSTVERRWRFCRAWLAQEFGEVPSDGE